MGHFTINLPGNRVGEVFWGKVRKLEFPFLWKSKDEKTGYIIRINPGESRNEYRLFKTKEGRWSQDPDGLVEVEDETTLAIKQAIEQHTK